MKKSVLALTVSLFAFNANALDKSTFGISAELGSKQFGLSATMNAKNGSGIRFGFLSSNDSVKSNFIKDEPSTNKDYKRGSEFDRYSYAGFSLGYNYAFNSGFSFWLGGDISKKRHFESWHNPEKDSDYAKGFYFIEKEKQKSFGVASGIAYEFNPFNIGLNYYGGAKEVTFSIGAIF